MAGLSNLDVPHAVAAMQAGEVIIYPTEAVFGLGCDPQNEQAVSRLLQLKSRSPDAGLILISDRYESFAPYIGEITVEERERAMAAWPGPVTWLFPRARGVPDWLAGKHPAIALRLTAHPVCRELCAAFGGPIVSTSANPSGQPAPTSRAQLEAYFHSDIAGIVKGELGGRESPSEIRDLLSGNVIRTG